MNYKNLDSINFLDAKFNQLSKSYGFKKIYPKSLSTMDISKEYENTNTKLLKVIDNLGDINILHEDPTISLIDSSVNNGKYFYLTNSFSFNKNKENLKGGVEILSSHNIYSDIESIIISYKLLENLGIDDFKIEIGHTHFIEKLLNIETLDMENRKLIYNAIHTKNISNIRKILNKINIPNNNKKSLLSLPMLFGDYKQVLNSTINLNIQGISEITNYLNKIILVLEKHNINLNKIKLDLSFTNKYSYYDGFIFKAYSDNLGKKLLQGGRYEILKRQGTGFGFDLENIIGVINMTKTKLTDDFTVLSQDINNNNAIKLANDLRNKGFNVNLKANKLNSKFIKKSNSLYIIDANKERLQVIDNKKNKQYKIQYSEFIKSFDNYIIKESIH